MEGQEVEISQVSEDGLNVGEPSLEPASVIPSRDIEDTKALPTIVVDGMDPEKELDSFGQEVEGIGDEKGDKITDEKIDDTELLPTLLVPSLPFDGEERQEREEKEEDKGEPAKVKCTSDMEYKRMKALEEMITTERAYVRSLDILVKVQYTVLPSTSL